MEPSSIPCRIYRVHVERETVGTLTFSPVSSFSHTFLRRLIWNLLLVGKTSIDFILQAHYRAITDINWHTTECDIVISTGIDSWLWAWDLRATRKPIFGLSAFKGSIYHTFLSLFWMLTYVLAGGTQVKWNRQDANIIASSHADEVLIWDRRVCSCDAPSY